MDDIVWLSGRTSTGLNYLFNMEVELFDKCLDSAIRIYELENKKD